MRLSPTPRLPLPVPSTGRALLSASFTRLTQQLFVQLRPKTFCIWKFMWHDGLLALLFLPPPHTHAPSPHTPSHNVLISWSLCVHVHACSSTWLPYMGMSLLACSLLLCPLWGLSLRVPSLSAPNPQSTPSLNQWQNLLPSCRCVCVCVGGGVHMYVGFVSTPPLLPSSPFPSPSGLWWGTVHYRHPHTASWVGGSVCANHTGAEQPSPSLSHLTIHQFTAFTSQGNAKILGIDSSQAEVWKMLKYCQPWCSSMVHTVLVMSPVYSNLADLALILYWDLLG